MAVTGPASAAVPEVSESTRPLSIVVAGGGTAGHIEPAMAVADAVRDLDPSIEVTALGTARGLETTLVPERGYRLELIPPSRCPASPTPIWPGCRYGFALRWRPPVEFSTR